MVENAIWISYDLGVQGDYASMYAWLDAHSAKECGDSLAFLVYKHSGETKERLKADLKRAITVDKRTRIYVIYRATDTKKIKGVFLFGGRRAPPWTGYSSRDAGAVDEEEL